MSTDINIEKYKNRIKDLEAQFSEQKFELEELNSLLKDEQNKRQFYQLIADFTFGWELWFDPNGPIKYCSPSCFDLTGYTANQIISSPGIEKLIVYESDRKNLLNFYLTRCHIWA